ncbi:peptidase [Clostridia bacterium]|nr:peptidase [Clostridia bacterium]
MYCGIIIDGHLDIAWNKQSLNRDFRVSSQEKFLLETEAIWNAEGIPTVGFPELLRANVRIVCGTIWVESENSSHPSSGKKYSTAKQAKEMAKEQYDYYCSLEKDTDTRVIRYQADIVYCLSNPSVGIALLIEGAEFIENEEDLQDWYNKGVRILAPVWERNVFGGCSNLGGGLTNEGKNLLVKMDHLNMVLDIAHMSEQCADDSLSIYSGVIINSHSACQSLCPGERQTTDTQIIRIHESGGLIALMLWDKILNPNGGGSSMDDILDHIKHIFWLTGCFDNIAIGSSMDGGFGSESLPAGMHDIGDLPLIANHLVANGIPFSDVEKIMFRNWERVIASAY